MELSKTTKDFLKEIEVENNTEIVEVENKVMIKDVFLRKSILNLYTMITFILFITLIRFLENWNKEIVNLFNNGIIIGIIIIGLYGIKILKDLIIFKKEDGYYKKIKNTYIEGINEKYFKSGIYVRNIIEDLEKNNIYSETEMKLLQYKIMKKKLSQEDILKISLRIKTSILKEVVLPSTTESIESQRNVL